MSAAFGPVFMLVDEHIHSARLMSRTLDAMHAPAQLVWLGHAGRAERTLARMIRKGTPRPNLLIVDLKADSGATLAFITAVRNRMEKEGIPIVAFVSEGDSIARVTATAAGARAVFDRHPNFAAYRREIIELVNLSVRESSTWPIRA